MSKSAPPFDRLDFVYVPSRDVAAETRQLVEVLGARLVFAIEAMGTRVAMVQLSSEPPARATRCTAASTWLSEVSRP